MLNFTNQTVTLVTEFAPAPVLDFTFVPPPVLDFTFPVPPNLQFTVLPAPVISFTLSAPGIQGPPGEPGTRGSLFLGGYPTVANLPVPDGVNVKIGDFALVQNESAIYELE